MNLLNKKCILWMDVFLWVADIFRGLHFKSSACVGGQMVCFTVVAASLPMMVLNSDYSTHLPPPLLLLLMDSVVGMCLPLRDVGGRGKKAENHWFRNCTILAIKPFKKMRWKVELKEF